MLEIQQPSPDIRPASTIGLGIIAVTFGVIGLWAAFVPLSSAVIGHGVVSTRSNRQTIQHYEGGIVRKILVHEGDHVEVGQPLIELNPVQADAALETARNQLFSLTARADRLTAERDRRAEIVFSPELEGQRAEPGIARAMTDERRQFAERRATLDAQVAVLRTRKAEYETEISAIDQQRASLQDQVKMLEDELGGLKTLYDQDLVPKPRLLAVQRELSQLRGQIGASLAERTKAQKSIGETELQINQLWQQFYQDVGKELSDIEIQVADIRQKYAVAEDAARRVSITAPMTGVVQNLKLFTVGGVVRPGEPLMEIAPDRGHLVIDARFSPNDIDSVYAGQPVQLRFSSFHSRTIPVITGTIKSVSQDRLTDEATHAAYYMAVVDVPDKTLPPELQGKLRAGLPADILAPTGSRTALQYVLGPLTTAFSRTMRER